MGDWTEGGHVNAGTIEVLRSEAELTPLRESWDALRTLPEQDWEVYWAALRARPAGAAPYVVALRGDEGLRAALLGWSEPGHVPLKLGYWTALKAPVKRIVIPPHGLLGAAQEDELRAMVERVVGDLRGRRADLATLEFLEDGSPALRAARSIPLRVWMRDRVSERRIHRRLDLPATFKAYDKAHKGLLQKVRKFEREFAGRFEHRLLTREDEIPAFCEGAEAIARGTYQRALGEGFLDSAQDRALLRAAARMGGWRAFATYVDGRMIAFWSGCQIGPHANFWWTAYDASYQAYSPGLVSSARMVERLIADGVTSLDFGGGDAPYKERLCNAEVWEECVRVFAPTLSGAAAVAVSGLDAAIGNLVRTRLKGLATRVKTPLRRWMARRQAAGQAGVTEKEAAS
jgi:CelD/BcsL family acetyltransferase involved in cellulose biosynthesis